MTKWYHGKPESPSLTSLLASVEDIYTFRSRPDVAAVWATPSPYESLRFAATEIAEALDAELRQNAIFARNNHKNLEVNAELADHVIMLVTAIQDPVFIRKNAWATMERVKEENGLVPFSILSNHSFCDALFINMAGILASYHLGAEYGWKHAVVEQLVRIFNNDAGMYDVVLERLARIEHKHVNAQKVKDL